MNGSVVAVGIGLTVSDSADHSGLYLDAATQAPVCCSLLQSFLDSRGATAAFKVASASALRTLDGRVGGPVDGDGAAGYKDHGSDESGDHRARH